MMTQQLGRLLGRCLSGVAVVVMALACGLLAAQADTLQDENRLLGGSYLSTDQGVRDLAFTMFRRTDARGLTAPSVAGLRSIDIRQSGVPSGAVAFVSGYNAAGDHGGVHYRYDASCTDSDTAGTILVPDGGGPGCWRIIFPNTDRVDVRYFGVVGDNSTDNATALQRAADADVRLYFPRGVYMTTETFFPKKGFTGDGPERSTIQAKDVFNGTESSNGESVLVSLGNIGKNGERFADFALNGAEAAPGDGGADVLLGTTLPEGTGHKGRHTFERLWLLSNNGGPHYVVDFKNGSTSFPGALTGSTWINVQVQSGTGGGLVRVEGPMGDQMTWIGSRFAMGQTATIAPLIIESFGATFIETFLSVGNGFTAGASQKWLIGIAGNTPTTWIGLDLEAGAGLSISNIEYIFNVRPDTGDPILNVTQLAFGVGGPISELVAIIKHKTVASGPSGILNFNGVQIGGGSSHWEWPFFLEVVQADQHTNSILELRLNGINLFIDQLEELVRESTGSFSSSGRPVVHITGNMEGLTLDHFVATTGSAGGLVPTHAKPTVVANDNFDLINGNGAVWRLTCPFDLSVQKAHSVLNAALATGDASITMAIEGVNITGGVIDITESGSAAGDKDSATPTAANDCDKGETLTLTVGGSSTAGSAGVTVELAPRILSS